MLNYVGCTELKCRGFHGTRAIALARATHSTGAVHHPRKLSISFAEEQYYQKAAVILFVNKSHQLLFAKWLVTPNDYNFKLQLVSCVHYDSLG